jgi:hypothetical protein
MSFRLLSATVLGLLMLATPAVATAKTTTVKVVTVKGGEITCYAVIPVAGGGINCSATSLPDTGELDPYVGLKAHGKAVLSERGDYAGYAKAKRATLKPGDRWRWRGITCTAADQAISCHNRDRHGFTIDPDGYTPR